MRTAASRPTIQRPYWSVWNAFSSTPSFAQKPANGGTPAMARKAMMNATAVYGMYLRKPPMIRMSWLSPLPWITVPAPRNSVALKNAWVITRKIAAP